MQFNDDFFESEEFKEILDSYETILQTGEQPFMDADDLVEIADYYDNNGEGDKAAAAIEHALDLFPNATMPNVFKARQALEEGDYETARNYADAIGDHDDPDYHYLMAEIMIAEGQPDKADEYLRDYGESVAAEEWEDFIKDCADLFVDYDISEKAYEWMMRSKGDDSNDFKELMGRTLLGLGKYKDSERIFNELIDRNPYSLNYWNALASAQLLDEDYPNAITSSEFAIAINPNDPNGLANKANSLMRLGNFEEALDFFQRLEKIDPNNEVVLLNEGICLVNSNRQEEALGRLERALEVATEESELLPQIYMELAFCYSHMQQADKALEMMDRCMEYPCDMADMMVIRGHLLLECNMVKEAEQSFKDAIQLSDNAPIVLLRIIVSLYDNRYLTSCYDMFKKFFRMVDSESPAYVKGYAYMALCCHTMGKFGEFLEYLEKAAKYNPRETKLVLGFLFPETMEPNEYVSYMKQRYQKKE